MPVRSFVWPGALTRIRHRRIELAPEVVRDFRECSFRLHAVPSVAHHLAGGSMKRAQDIRFGLGVYDAGQGVEGYGAPE